MTAAEPGTDPAAVPTPATTALLRARDVGVRYPGTTVAAPASASFDIAPGEVVLLLGPSGCGKSSLALTLNGLIPQAVPATVTGAVQIDGVDAATRSVAQLSTRVGMVFQDPDAQVVTGTVLDEVAFGPENLCLPVDDVLARTENALRRVGLWERRTENPDRLSGGGRQRLAIACALALRTPLLVLDEPTANLDPRGIDDVYAALADVSSGPDPCAVLLVEHNLDAAVAFTTRVVVLDADGRTLADGPVDDVLRTRAAQLHALGVWLPVSTLAALRLQRAGWHFDRLPLTPDELAAAVEDPGAPPVTATAPTPVPARAHPTTRTRSLQDAAESTPHAAPLIEVTGLTLRRGGATVLHDVDLAVAPGEFVAVIGANGAGKTSLIQAMSGVVPVPTRTVRVGGTDLARADHRVLARRIGFVFQNPEHQFVAHTVYDELAHGLRSEHLPGADVDARVQDMLRRFGLDEHADRHPFLLSGGQKRRLSVGTALIAGAPVLALDEPTFGQDRARADALLRLLDDLNEAGTTIVIVSHDLQSVAEHAHRTVVVSDGRILADDETGRVLADDDLLARAGLWAPPLARALRGVRHPLLAGRTRLADLPGAAQRAARSGAADAAGAEPGATP